MQQYKRKPQVIEAYQFDSKEVPCDRPGVWYSVTDGVWYSVTDGKYFVRDSSGTQYQVTDGDWIIREDDGEGHYTLTDEWFKHYYQPAGQCDKLQGQLSENVRKCERRLSELLGYSVPQPLPALIDDVQKRFQEFERVKNLCAKERFEIDQALGRVLGCPGFPEEHAALDGLVCTGGRTPITLALTVKSQWEQMKKELCEAMHGERSVNGECGQTLSHLVAEACGQLRLADGLVQRFLHNQFGRKFKAPYTAQGGAFNVSAN